MHNIQSFFHRIYQAISSNNLVQSLLCCLLVVWCCFEVKIADPDLFARLAVGRLILDSGQVPLQDPFAYTMKNTAWIDHEWLSGVVFYAIWSRFGDVGLFLLKIIVACITVLFLGYARNNIVPRCKDGLFWAIILLLDGWYVWATNVRSQIFTYLGISFVLLALVEFERKGKVRLLILLPAVMMFWANAHGGFVVGLGFLGLYTGCRFFLDRMKMLPLLIATICTTAATFINPYGIVIYWRFIVDAVFKHRPTIPEWAAIQLWSIHGVFCGILLFILLVGARRREVKHDIFGVLILALSLLEGLRSQRLIAIFYMCYAVYGAPYTAAFLSYVNEQIPHLLLKMKHAAAIVLLTLCLPYVVFAIFSSSIWREGSFDIRDYPRDALAWLQGNRSHGKLLCHFNVGSYALWQLYPNFLVSFDGRYETVYPDQTLRDVEMALSSPSKEQQESFSKVQPDFVLLSTGWESYAQRDSAFPGWKVIFKDEKYAILEP